MHTCAITIWSSKCFTSSWSSSLISPSHKRWEMDISYRWSVLSRIHRFVITLLCHQSNQHVPPASSNEEKKYYFIERHYRQNHTLIYVTCSTIGDPDRVAHWGYCNMILRRTGRIHESEISLFSDNDHWIRSSTIQVFIGGERVCSCFAQIIGEAVVMETKRIRLLNFCIKKK